MRHFAFAIILFASALISGASFAADFEKGLKAYRALRYATAMKEWRPLAERGNVEAQYYVGSLYEEGKGVLQDYKQSFYWYKLAAEQGYTWGFYGVGKAYRHGYGVPQDYIIAHMWYNLATMNNFGFSNGRDEVAENMTPAQIEEAQSLARQCVEQEYRGCDKLKVN